jgi:hypothetical protein
MQDNDELQAEIDRDEAEKAAMERQAQLLVEAFEKVLGTAEGKRVIWWIMGECGVFTISMKGNSYTFFNEGMRNIGLKLMDRVMETNPSLYQEMYEQARKDAQ